MFKGSMPGWMSNLVTGLATALFTFAATYFGFLRDRGQQDISWADMLRADLKDAKEEWRADKAEMKEEVVRLTSRVKELENEVLVTRHAKERAEERTANLIEQMENAHTTSVLRKDAEIINLRNQVSVLRGEVSDLRRSLNNNENRGEPRSSDETTGAVPPKGEHDVH